MEEFFKQYDEMEGKPIPVTIETTDDRLFQAARSAMTGLLANHLIIDICDHSAFKQIAEWSVDQAKELIKQLDNQ